METLEICIVGHVASYSVSKVNWNITVKSKRLFIKCIKYLLIVT